MALNRIQFRDQNGGNLYTCPINPSTWENQDNDDVVVIDVIGNTSVRFHKSFDSRSRRLIWPAYNNSNTTFASMVTELKGYKGQLKQINFKTIDYLSHEWKNIKIINVSTNLLIGGQLRYGLTLEYKFTESV